jgi:hypothetical protein
VAVGLRSEVRDGPDGEEDVCVAERESALSDPGASDVDRSGAEVVGAVLEAGAVVVGEEGVDGLESRCDEALVSAPIVVVPDVWELPTSADTGFCPTTSIPVTIPMAMPKTAAA